MARGRQPSEGVRPTGKNCRPPMAWQIPTKAILAVRRKRALRVSGGAVAQSRDYLVDQWRGRAAQSWPRWRQIESLRGTQPDSGPALARRRSLGRACFVQVAGALWRHRTTEAGRVLRFNSTPVCTVDPGSFGQLTVQKRLSVPLALYQRGP